PDYQRLRVASVRRYGARAAKRGDPVAPPAQFEMRSTLTVIFIRASPVSGESDGFAGTSVTPVPETRVNCDEPLDTVIRPEKTNGLVTVLSRPKPKADNVCVLRV